MKNIWKQLLLFSAIAGGTTFFAGCVPDEELNLAGYPNIIPGVSIEGAKGAAVVNIAATYDDTGKLVFDNSYERTYLITLSTPSAEDVTLNIEPHLLNIPAEKIVLSASKIVIPAGSVNGSVTVGLGEANLDFIGDDVNAQTYELGVKIASAEGLNLALPENNGAKVVITKDAYVSRGFVVGEDGNEVTFLRVYRDGAIVNEKGMSYKFNVKLDKPARADVKVTFSSTGLAEQFLGGMVLTPAMVTIPAGKIESDEIGWTLTDDFLLTNADAETYTIVLNAAFESTDPTVKAHEENSALTFTVEKVNNGTTQISEMKAEWAMFDRADWSATGNGGGNGNESVLDGSTRSSADRSDNKLAIVVDMQEAKTMTGFALRYYSAGSSAETVRFSYSMDNVTWLTMAPVLVDAKATVHWFELAASASARYLRVEVLERWGANIYLAEVEVYGKK